MRHPWLRRLILPLWAVWLALAVTEQPLSFDCPMHAAAGTVSAMPGMAPMASADQTHPDTPANARCCSCLGDCGTAASVTLPASDDVAAIQFATPVTRVAEVTGRSIPVVRTDLALPFANAPPLSALI